MTDRERIEKRCVSEGLRILDWRDDPGDGLTASLGRFEVVTDEYDDDGLYSGDVGKLEASVVGAAQYGNQRVHFGFTPDDSDGATEVTDLSAVEPTDD